MNVDYKINGRMRVENYSIKLLLKKIRELNKKVHQCKCQIRICERMIKKNKPLLNDTFVSHDELCIWRFELNEQIFLKRRYSSMLKELQKVYSKKIQNQDN